MKPKAKKLLAPAACILLLFLFAVRVYTLNHMYPPAAVQIIPFGETVQSGNLEYTVTNSRWFSSYDEMLDFCAKDEETRALLDSKLQVPYDSKWCIIEFEAANCSDEECRFPFEMNLEKGPWSFGASNPLCLLLNGKDFNAQEVMSVTIAPRSTAAVFVAYCLPYIPKTKQYTEEEWAAASLADYDIPLQLYPAKICLELVPEP